MSRSVRPRIEGAAVFCTVGSVVLEGRLRRITGWRSGIYMFAASVRAAFVFETTSQRCAADMAE